MTGTPVAILPSRDEPDTIAGVVTAVDAALADEQALIVHADASAAPDTAVAFRATPTRARTVCLTDLPVGKGIQIRTALNYIAPTGQVLLADTDTRNPSPTIYCALLDAVAGAAAIALADYRRYWDEANLTNHLARPLIAAATGHDVPQPLAGDVALANTAVADLDDRYAALPAELAHRVDGYGIDAFVLHTAVASGGPVTSVRLASTKRHAPSFPHLSAIFAQAVPVLLHPAATQHPYAPPIGEFRLADRALPDRQRDTMRDTLRQTRPAASRYDGICWTHAVAASWRAVAAGVSAVTAAEWLWPAYLDHVHAWLTSAANTSVAQRADCLRANATDVLAMLTTNRENPS